MEQKKDYRLLRPFDLEAAKRGDFVQTTGDDERGRFIAENDSEIVIDFERAGFVIYEEDIMCQLRMKPLCWVEGRPVYKGDKLWSKVVPGLVYIADQFEGELLISNGSTNGNCEESINLTWTPPKVKREGWVNIYRSPFEGLVASVSHAHASKDSADGAQRMGRVACVRIEWEE